MSKTQVSNFISLLALPPLVLILASFNLVVDGNFLAFLSWLIFIFVGGLLPMVVDIYKYLSKGKQFSLPRQMRNDVYLVGVFSFSVASVVLGSQLLQNELWMFLAMLQAIFFGLFLVVNRFFDKASLHMGVSSFWLLILIDKVSLVWGVGLFFLPAIAWARVYLEKHTWIQISLGLTIGMSVGLLSWLP